MPLDPPEEQISPDSPVASEPFPALPPESQTTPWSLRDLGLFLLFAPLALLIANVAVVAGYATLRSLLSWGNPSIPVQHNTFFLLAFQLLFQGLLLGFVYSLVVIHHRRPFWAGLSWRKPSLGQTLWFSLGGVLLAFAIQWAPNILPETRTFPLEQMFSSPAAGYTIGAYAILVAPWAEEVLFRGFLFGIFERRASLGLAIVLTALLFGGLHVPEYWGAWNHVVLISLVGLTFSLARGLTRSLAPSIILHLSYNTSLIAGLFIQTQGFQNLK
jgi:membrane protease YdiL (CAAX protease family)